MKLFVIFWLTLCYSTNMQAGNQNAPYIYYYSFSKQAFIVERADGSDSRILASYKLPDKHVSIEGAGWSPSKKWFAWTSETEGGGSTEAAYIVSSEGTNLIRIFPKDVQVIDMNWSSQYDLLMVSYYDDTRNYTEQLIIFDPALQKSVVSISAEDLTGSSASYFYQKVWSPDGQSLALEAGNTITLLQMTGDYRVLKSAIDGTDTCSDFRTLPHWFKDGRLSYLSQDKSTLLIDDGTKSTPLAKLPNGNIRSIDWSPDERYAQIYIQPSENTFQYELWLFNFQNHSVNLAFDNVLFVNNCNAPFNSTAWNAKNQSVFVSDDNQLWLLDANHISQIEVNEDGQVGEATPLRWSQNGDLLFVWQNQGTYTAQIYLYESASGRTKPITNSVGYYFTTMHGTQLAYSDGGGAVIEDIRTHAQNHITFQALPKYGSISVSSMFWHPTADWLFLLSENVEYQYLVNIVSADGKIQRPLSLCRLEAKACFGWLS